MPATFRALDFLIIGRSLLSSVGDRNAEVYRSLIRELSRMGHRTTFLEHRPPAGAPPLDMLRSPYCEVWSYETTDQMLHDYRAAVESADVVLLGSGVRNARRVAEWVVEEAQGRRVYYDLDLSYTLHHLNGDLGEDSYDKCLSRESLRDFDLYLSTSGGPLLARMQTDYGAPLARPLYASIDPYYYYRTDADIKYDLGFLGNYKVDRSERLAELLLEPARWTPNRHFALAGDGYDNTQTWPTNVTHVEHLPVTNHVDFYNRQGCTLFITNDNRREVGYSPTSRLFAAAACGVPILSDRWEGLESFFEPNREIYQVDDCNGVLDILYHSEAEDRRRLGERARERVLAEHTAAQRARQFMDYLKEVMD